MNHEGHKEHEALDPRTQAAARQAVDAGLKVHRALGLGLLESAYEHCLAFELTQRGVRIRRQIALPLVYEDTRLDAGYRLDLIVGEAVIDALAPIHDAQLLTYLKLSGLRLGLLMNFNVVLFKQGLKRLIL
jgi:GxxExxY protein